MSLAYLASPYSHPDESIRRMRSRAAALAAADLLKQGRHVYSPIVHNVAVIEAAPELVAGWKHWSAFDLEILDRCDHLIILMLDGWEESAGIQGEIEAAKNLGTPIAYMAPSEALLKAAASPPEPTDSARLEWLLHHTSGKELRRLGVVTSSGGLAWGRPAVDQAMGIADAKS